VAELRGLHMRRNCCAEFPAEAGKIFQPSPNASFIVRQWFRNGGVIRNRYREATSSGA
jgi:hypothetical protein